MCSISMYLQANRIAAKMKSINDQGIVVWLRFAHEVNMHHFLYPLNILRNANG